MRNYYKQSGLVTLAWVGLFAALLFLLTYLPRQRPPVLPLVPGGGITAYDRYRRHTLSYVLWSMPLAS